MINTILNEISQDKLTDDSRMNIESDYIQANINAYQSLRSRDYDKAKNIYKECHNMAKTLNDPYKQCDALTNIGITQFFLGKIIDSIEMLESAYRICSIIPKDNKNNNLLYLKVLANLCLGLLSIGKTGEALNYSNNIVDFIRKEIEIMNQVTYLRSVLYIFFRVESLISFFEQNSNLFNDKINITNENKNSEEVHQRLVRKIIYFLHKYLKDNDIDSWIQCLNEEKENFKTIQDYNGFVFATFNQYTSLYVKNPSNIQEAKAKINSVRKVLLGNINQESQDEEKSVEKILVEMKEKMEMSLQIYKKLYDLEKELKSRLNNFNINDVQLHDNKTSKIFIKLFLKYALNYLDSEISETGNDNDMRYLRQLKSHIDLTLKLVEKDEIDLSTIKLYNIDPEIANSLKNLFTNLLFIKQKFTLQNYFKTFMYQTLGYQTKNELKKMKEKKFLAMLIKFYNIICEGDVLTKINFTSSGKKEHFYRLVSEANSIKVYKKRTDKNPYKVIPIDEITKISYGVSSSNLRKRFINMKNSQLKSPWLFLSIITRDRSIDLYLEESKLTQWFYGIKYYFTQNNQYWKTISVNNFVLTKLKLKLMYNLKDFYEKEKAGENTGKYKNLIDNLAQGNIIIIIVQLEKGIQNFSFAKILLLYLKIKNINFN